MITGRVGQPWPGPNSLLAFCSVNAVTKSSRITLSRVSILISKSSVRQ